MLYTDMHNIVALLGCRFVWARNDHQHDSFAQISEVLGGIADSSIHGTGRMTAIFIA
jgi:hypothetical protein